MDEVPSMRPISNCLISSKVSVMIAGCFPLSQRPSEPRVIACSMVETDSGLLETRYRVQCCFDDAFHGKRLLVMMNEMQKLPSRSSLN